MPDVDLTIGTSNDGDVVVDGLAGGSLRPTVTRGQEVRLTLYFGETGASATAPRTRYETLRDYLDYVSAATTFVGEGPTAYWRETPADGRSLLMSFTPATGLRIPGFWGVLVDGGDVAGETGVPLQLEFQVFVIAELSEFADRAAVATAREL